MMQTRWVFTCILFLTFAHIFGKMINHKLMQKSGEGSNKPILRPIRRAIRNYVPTGSATITLIYQRSLMPKVRWFKQSPTALPHAEIANMINIDGDRRYSLRSISSHDITAVTLTIHGVEDRFPVKFVTCFSIEEIPFQYQLDTIIEEAVVSRTDFLDGIVWAKTPPSTITFTPQGQLSVTCAITLETESARFTDELNIYRSYLDRKQDMTTWQTSHNQLMSIGCGKIHKDRDNYAESSGKYTYAGYREKNLFAATEKERNAVRYEVSFQVLNGSQDDIGVYTCAGERHRDRTFISSWVRLVELDRPALIFVACDDAMINRTARNARPNSGQSENLIRVKLTMNRVACLRCRAYDYLTSRIYLRKDGENIVSSTGTMALDWHLNVADGGLSELSVTFLQPNMLDAGIYECVVKNDSGSDRVKFAVSLK